jgi:hypothetical protein
MSKPIIFISKISAKFIKNFWTVLLQITSTFKLPMINNFLTSNNC